MLTVANQYDQKYRHELKYLMDVSEAEIVKVCLAGMLQRDENTGQNGGYKIRSLYFDDYWNSAYEEKLMGIAERRKYRIRIYNDSDAIIRLERKLKKGAYISKHAAVLTRDETEHLIGGEYDFLYGHPQQLCREFYFECVNNIMRPRAIVDYEREPFVFESGDVRVTFDMNVRAALLSFNIFDQNLPVVHVLEPHQLILEIKFTEFLPDFIQKLLPRRLGQQLSLSKYAMAREMMKWVICR